MEKILSEETLSCFRQLTAEAQHIVICAHVNPDGDALGSSLAMKKYLSREGKDVQVVVPTSFPDFLRWLPGATEVKVYARHEEEVADVVKAADLFVVADFNDPSRRRTTITRSLVWQIARTAIW